MAHKKGVGSTDNGRDSLPKYLGVKKFGGQVVKAGNILVRQRGTKFHPGVNVYISRDHTLHAAIDGVVNFKRTSENRRVVFIAPLNAPAETLDVIKTVKVKAAKPAAPKAEVKATVTKTVAAPKAEVKATPAVEVTETAPTVTTTVTTRTITPEPVVEVKAAVEEVKETASTTSSTTTTTVKTLDLDALKASGATVTTTVTSTPIENVEEKPAKKVKADDLTKIEGIGPKIAELLNEAGITTFAELSNTETDKIQSILNAAGSRFSIHNPSTWAKQAGLAAEGKWEELKAWQDELDGGKE